RDGSSGMRSIGFASGRVPVIGFGGISSGASGLRRVRNLAEPGGRMPHLWMGCPSLPGGRRVAGLFRECCGGPQTFPHLIWRLAAGRANHLKGLILAQNERWWRGLGMQVV